MKRGLALSVALALMLMHSAGSAQVRPTDENVPCHDFKDVLALFDRLGYTQQAWKTGIHEVPRVYLEDIPDSWRDRSAGMLSAADKKRLFFRVLAPIVLRINELIAADRTHVKEITDQLAIGHGVSPGDQAWLKQLAVRYKVLKSADERLDPALCRELLLRVDIVPPALSLAQAASESGWGTSRFAAEGNALFGQWTWGHGMVPTEQRTSAHDDYRVAAFGSTAEAAYAYALNLNSVEAYRDLRLMRAQLRHENRRISGTVLAETLIHYSERGEAYVEEIKTIIRQNRLDAADDAYLRRMAVIHIVPAEPGSE